MALDGSAVVDAANVAYTEKTPDGKPKVSNLVAMYKALQDKGLEPYFVVEASLRYEIDDPAQLEGLLNGPNYHQAPAETDADYFVLEIAKDKDAYVVSNDLFDPYQEEYGWIQERRVPFMIVDGEVELYERKLDPHDDAGAEKRKKRR